MLVPWLPVSAHTGLIYACVRAGRLSIDDFAGVIDVYVSCDLSNASNKTRMLEIGIPIP